MKPEGGGSSGSCHRPGENPVGASARPYQLLAQSGESPCGGLLHGDRADLSRLSAQAWNGLDGRIRCFLCGDPTSPDCISTKLGQHLGNTWQNRAPATRIGSATELKTTAKEMTQPRVEPVRKEPGIAKPINA